MITDERLASIRARLEAVGDLDILGWQVRMDLCDGVTKMHQTLHVRPGVAWSEEYTQGEYGKIERDPDGYCCWIEHDPDNKQAIAEFVAHSRTYVHELLAEVERLRRLVPTTATS